ncbi:DUF1120 domain-containing protein [Pseudomonas sp. HR96]|uniref:DUF1120 domain-containing protein n=1 Tax=Pseudomonas sp. HR96 TaxID=1027966 RepID=UPI002A765159|nr:DUF1120 domain-containing protein [Pseudomonas sp. HR96]WPP01894.1 DUF1120 domain-containing protein [Pseudomonas sp. HR96]
MNAVAQPVQLAITGTVSPQACQLNTQEEGINYRQIASGLLHPTGFTPLPPAEMAILINCQRPTLFAVSLRDNRAGTVPDGMDAQFGELPGRLFGLGEVAGKRLGAYTATFGRMQIGPMPLYPISAPSDRSGWTLVGEQTLSPDPGEGLQYAWSWGNAPGRHTPSSIDRVVSNIWIRPYLNRVADLPDVGNDSALDGSMTITLHYL